MADIREDDTLVIDEVDYPVKMIVQQPFTPVVSAGFRLRATERIRIKRPPAISGGKVGAAAAVSGVFYQGTPLEPVDAQTRASMGFETPAQIYRTFVEGDPFLEVWVEKVKVKI